MIVPMKKTILIVQAKDADPALQKLRSAGVMHVQHSQAPKGKNIDLINDDLSVINSALDILSEKKFLEGQLPAKAKELSDWKVTALHIIDLHKRLEHLEDYSLHMANNITQWEAWGDFEPEKIDALAQKNIYLRFYQVPFKEIKDFPPEAIVKKVSAARGIVNCVVISEGKINIPFKELSLPKISLEKMRLRLAEDQKLMESLREEIKKHVCYREDFLSIKKHLASELELYEALKGMGQSGSLLYLTGYIPYDQTEPLLKIAKQERWGLAVSDPAEEDNVPVLLRNPRWISLITPVFRFLEILPGYRELDISLPFLIFFSIFFGILIGDAGYGFAYIIITFMLHRKAKKKNADNSAFSLFYILSLCAIIWGTLTGTFFGHEWLMKAGYKPLAPGLNDDKVLQRVCFFIGATHLSIAHAWRAILKLPSLAALSDVGWGCILWAAFFIARLLILGDPFPPYVKWLIIIGVAQVIFFTNPQKNILKVIGEGLGTLALSLMNNFTDVVSYVRLFAVGLAGVAIADAFNAMAAQVGGGSLVAIIASAFIVLIGHGLGIVLGPVSVLVHGVRLNVLEFSGHANISWSGEAYRPLKE